MRYHRELLTIILLFGVVLALSSGPVPAGPKGENVARYYGTALSTLGVAEAGLYEVDGKDFALLPEKRLLVVTRNYASVRGYRGASVLGIVLSSDGKVAQVLLLHTPDTRSYMRRLARKLSRLAEQSVDSDKRPALALTGATRSARAVTVTVNQTLDKFAPVFKKLVLADDGIRYDGKALSPTSTLAAK